jgi:hypothetical protein
MIGFVPQPFRGMPIADFLELRDHLPQHVGSFARILAIQVSCCTPR